MLDDGSNLVGIGLYTPAEAGRLLRIPLGKLGRWMRGYRVGGRDYPPLWQPQINLGDSHLYLGFRDLMEARVADALIKQGLSAIRVRRAIDAARKLIGQERPLSNNRFRTDGRNIFLQTMEEDDEPRLINVLSRQYAFEKVLDPLLRTIEFDPHGEPLVWWPAGKSEGIVVDPARAFGQPIDAESSVPTAVLAAAEATLGVREAARLYDVSEAAVRHSARFEAGLRAA